MMPLKANEEFLIQPSSSSDEGAEETDFKVLPIDPEVLVRQRQMLLDDLPKIEEPKPEPPPAPFQYSIREILVLTTVLAVVLALFQFVRAQVFAGIVALIAMLALPMLGQIPKPARKIWWMVLGIYVLACIVALATSGK